MVSARLPRRAAAASGRQMAETAVTTKPGRIARLMRRRAACPLRIATRVRAQEEASEILVGWIQLAVVLGFSAVST